jgi:hypothetical protein
MTLLHVSAYNDHLQGGEQRKEYWLIMLQMCNYNTKINIMNKIHISFVNDIPEDGQCKPKHVRRSVIYLQKYCLFTVVQLLEH